MPRWFPYAVVALFGFYFPLALWSQYRWVDPRPKGTVVIQLYGPFETYGHAAINYREAIALLAFADDESKDEARSPVVIYENDRLLGPGHSSFLDIRDRGMGRYAVWRSQGIVFSASDNSDPSENGRVYWAVVP
jgi:hypothetical protein